VKRHDVAFGPFMEIRDARSKIRCERSGRNIDRSYFVVPGTSRNEQ
jgi:hypothetical protein